MSNTGISYDHKTIFALQPELGITGHPASTHDDGIGQGIAQSVRIVTNSPSDDHEGLGRDQSFHGRKMGSQAVSQCDCVSRPVGTQPHIGSDLFGNSCGVFLGGTISLELRCNPPTETVQQLPSELSATT